ncbi:glypican-5 isoform X2 [Oryzias melastigma]|uniref:Glypican-5-like n=1 Tax=Oryzias melastigma TaxID=30732 RepID=A0A3B3CUQ2_ORYME|nr:glypican-5 isoform X2 [Oryzias melastigma]
MSRGGSSRLNSRSAVWSVTVAVFLMSVIDADAYSCHEVRTAFQLRQVGPLSRVPETPGTDVDLLICKHKGPSCCTRKTEQSYQVAVKRETLQNVQSYSYEPKHLFSTHANAFQEMFRSLLSFSQGHLSSLLEDTYLSLFHHARPHVHQLFSSLSQYLHGANVSVETTVQRFFNSIFPLVYEKLINPDMEGSLMEGSEISDCLRTIRQDVNPFGYHPALMAEELAGALGAGRQLGLALKEGVEAMNATEHASFTKDCEKNLVKMMYCSHCRGLTLFKPCLGYCLNVMRGCLASLSELDQPWRQYINLLEQLTHAAAGKHSLELALLGVTGHINEALLYAQLHGPLITATVDKVCGLSTGEPKGMQPSTSPEVTTPSMTSASSAAPTQFPSDQELQQFAHLRGEFLLHLKPIKSFFMILPNTLCRGDAAVEDSTCWSGQDVVESYVSKVAEPGLYGQRQNPEFKVRSMDPRVVEVKERLEHFNQETLERFPDLEELEEFGSGEEDGSTEECDDEDGCQNSGDGQEGNPHGGESIYTESTGRQPEENPSKPPPVRVIGGSPSAFWLQSCSFALLSAGLGLQWMLL